jgi:hypothetical protein
MRSIRLTMARAELLRALQTLGVTRKRRFSSSLPVWLRLLPGAKELQMVEDGGQVTASVPAKGTWPAVGATVNLFSLKRAVTHCHGDSVQLHAINDAVALWADRWHVRLKLMPFGPESRVHRLPKSAGAGVADLPLFRWADRKLL